MLSSEYNAENVNLDEYNDFIDHVFNICEEERFKPKKYSSIVRVEFLSHDNQPTVMTDIKPNDENELKQIINDIIKARPNLRYNQIIDIKIEFLSRPIKSMLAIQMLKNDIRQKFKSLPVL